MGHLDKCAGCDAVYFERDDGTEQREWYGFCKTCTTELVVVTTIMKQIGVNK